MTNGDNDIEPKKPRREASGVVAIILALGMVIALNVLTGALLWAAAVRLGVDPDSGLSDNGVQILLAWGGGIISVIAGYVGYVVGKKVNGSSTMKDEGTQAK
jgi:hypothetical protein